MEELRAYAKNMMCLDDPNLIEIRGDYSSPRAMTLQLELRETNPAKRYSEQSSPVVSYMPPVAEPAESSTPPVNIGDINSQRIDNLESNLESMYEYFVTYLRDEEERQRDKADDDEMRADEVEDMEISSGEVEDDYNQFMPPNSDVAGDWDRNETDDGSSDDGDWSRGDSENGYDGP